MPPLMQLPAYQSNALLDFTPLNQGIQQYKADAEKARRQQVAQQAGNALMGGDYKGAMGTALAGDRADLAGLALQAKGQASSEASQEIDREHKLAQMYGGAAQRVLETKDPKLWGAILNSHPEMGNKLRRAGIDPNDHIGGAQFLMSQAQGYRDPLDIEAKKAGIEKDRAQAQMARMGGGDPMPIKEWRAFQLMNPQQQERYLLMKRAAERPIDLGNEWVRPNAANPSAGPTPIARKDLIGAESEKAQGKLTGERIAGWPKAEFAYKQFETKSTLVDTTIDKAVGRIGSMTSGVGAVLANLPNTEARALKGDLDTIRANLGFGELQAMREASPTGGALGAVSERENVLLQSTKASIDQALNGGVLRENLTTIKRNLAELREIQRQKFYADKQRYGGASAPAPAAPAAPGNGGWSARRID